MTYVARGTPSDLLLPAADLGTERSVLSALPDAAELALRGVAEPPQMDDRRDGPAETTLQEVAAEAGLARVEIVEWRDLEHPEAGGSEVHAARIAQRWAAAGIDVVVRASRAPGAARTATHDGYRVERPAGRYRVFPAVGMGALRRRGARPDGVVEVWNGMPFLSPLWSRGPRAVFIHHVHDGMWDLVLPAPLAGLGKYMERHLAPPLYRGTPVVTLSGSSRRTIIDLLHLPPEHVTVVPPGIDERFSPGPERSPEPLVVAVGRLVGYKRFDVLVDVLVRLRQRIPTLRALLAGEGSEQEAVASRIGAHGASSWLRMAGRVSDDELLRTYREAWVLASTSAFEGWGMTITEAAACGTPAVATRIPGHLDAVQDGVSGLLTDTPAQMEEALAAVLCDTALRRQLSRGALARASLLTWDQTALGTLRVLAADARRRRSPRG